MNAGESVAPIMMVDGGGGRRKGERMIWIRGRGGHKQSQNKNNPGGFWTGRNGLKQSTEGGGGGEGKCTNKRGKRT